ncbi:pentatricopeptide repeat-containing protein At3g13880 [Ziziphus jujuba]|uniref:Pentatricopeptide repeat-containing protein At3g13880 n=1 Tax=Ziziphus jujuba TaxID=326968 RepID=A0ABM3IL70_ZIZJJ|nr:pentatricopeptide repeat-containing protein At3g13880 [Ziziphus jujuba]
MMLEKTKAKTPNILFNNPIEFIDPVIFRTQPKNSSTSLPRIITPSSNYSDPRPSFLNLDSVTYTRLFQFSTKTGFLNHGKLAHAHMVKTNHRPCVFLLNNLLYMYCKCDELDTARKLLDRMPKRNVVSYNSLISGYTKMGSFDNVMSLFNEGRVAGLKLDKFTYAGALSVCGQTGEIEVGKLIHGLIVVGGLASQIFLTNALIDMYSKCGNVDRARLLFENFDQLDGVSWNSMISGYVQSGAIKEMLSLLVKMHQDGLSLTTYTLGSVLKACSAKLDNSEPYGKMLHSCIVKLGFDLDFVVCTALLDMYAKTGELNDAVQIFKIVPNRNVVMYNAMISALLLDEAISSQHANEAFNLLRKMQMEGMKPSKFTFASMLKACNAVEAFEYGKQIQGQICKNNLQEDEFIGSALIDLYSSFGSIEDGRRCFNLLPKLDIVSWTSMIVGYVQNGKFESAFTLFYELLAAGSKPDEFLISSMLSACADLAAARSGEQIQGFAIKNGIEKFTMVQNSQICMYAKSGDIDSANLTFKQIESPDVVSWSVMICSHAQHGCARQALELFESMEDCGITPNHITFIGVLTACSHGGLVKEGLRYLERMKKDYGMTCSVKHCTCVVDLLGRAGQLVDAENFILTSDFKDNPVMWRALLSACRIYKDSTIAKRIADRVIELEPHAAASYVLLYNTYTDAGIDLPATEIRELMKDRGVKKEPGLSWIEVGSKVHTFVVGDKSHPMNELIYARLEAMLAKIKTNEGLFSNTESGQKDNKLVNNHSEKLAVTFGIISLPKSAPVRVMKNLRVCSDCHTTMKLFSKLERREIILRDPFRFHHFKEGDCSCRDYW